MGCADSKQAPTETRADEPSSMMEKPRSGTAAPQSITQQEQQAASAGAAAVEAPVAAEAIEKRAQEEHDAAMKLQSGAACYLAKKNEQKETEGSVAAPQTEAESPGEEAAPRPSVFEKMGAQIGAFITEVVLGQRAPQPSKYVIVDFDNEAKPDGGAVPLEKDMGDAELFWEDITKGRKPAAPGTRPVLVIMYGPPGSGKGKALAALYARNGWRADRFVHLDPDACRVYCREYRLGISGAHASKLESVQREYGEQLTATPWISPDGRFREEGFSVDGAFLALKNATLRSQFLVREKMLWGHKVTQLSDEKFVDRALIRGYDCIYDTMGNEPNKFLRELMRRARSQHDYRVVVCGCYAPWETVRERGRDRAAKEGRHLDEAFAKVNFDVMFPDGQIDTTHHDKFAMPAEEKYLPGGELRPGDERYLYDNSGHGVVPSLFRHDVTPEAPAAAGDGGARM